MLILYYGLILVSALMFSSRFLCSKVYQKKAGSDVMASMASTVYTSIISMVTMFLLSGFRLEFSWFSFGISMIYCINSFALTIFGFKALKYANLSIYSLFMMLGSIVLPTSFAILFYNEALTWARGICFVCIAAALFSTVKKGEGNKKAYFYYCLVFLCNGLAGIISKIHQSSPEAVSTSNFLFICAVINFAVCSFVLLYFSKKSKEFHRVFSPSPIFWAMLGGVIMAVANFINIDMLKYVDVAVHSVITTGGTLVFSPIIGLCVKEKITVRTAVGVSLAVVAVVFAVL